MKKKRYKKVKIVVINILVFVAIIMFSTVIWNQFYARYEELNETDRQILNELDQYCKNTKIKDIWKEFELGDKTILAMEDFFGSAYIINPTNKIHSIFAKEIKMPAESQIEVYRIVPIAPQLLQFKFDGNFNEIGKQYRIYGNDVYYTKYNEIDSVNKQFASTHYITFLNHEAFHYYMQKHWANGNIYSTDDMSKEDQELLYEEYEILGKIQKELLNKNKKQEIFLKYTREYVSIVEERLKNNPVYVKQEMDRETAEGTSTYVGIKASELVGYDYGVMYFDNVKDVPFSDLRRTVESGQFDIRYLADRIPYETGALLCFLMDQLEIPDWQEQLNGQTKQKQITLYSIIRNYVKDKDSLEK